MNSTNIELCTAITSGKEKDKRKTNVEIYATAQEAKSNDNNLIIEYNTYQLRSALKQRTTSPRQTP